MYDANRSKIAAVAVIFSIRVSTQHFINTPDVACDAANICNHTWVPVCGQDQHDLNHRLFLDECDMYEYNCENYKLYIKIDSQTCSYKCTSGQQKFNTADVETPTLPYTTKPTSNNAMTPTAEVTTSQTASTTDTDEVSSMTNEAGTTASISTPVTNVTDDDTKDNQQENITSTDNTESKETNADDNSNGNYDEASTTMTDNTEITRANSTVKNRTCYPEDCFVPSTWETTHESERRDFYQILKQRFGDNIKLLRDTTHFPKIVQITRNDEGFISGQHKEKINNNIINK